MTASLFIIGNYVHDGVCGDGIDIRGMGAGRITAQVNYNFVTRLPQCSSVRTMEGIGTQVTGNSVLRASLYGNTEAYNGSTGANADSLFVNPAEAGTLVEIHRLELLHDRDRGSIDERLRVYRQQRERHVLGRRRV